MAERGVEFVCGEVVHVGVEVVLVGVEVVVVGFEVVSVVFWVWVCPGLAMAGSGQGIGC